MDNKHMKRCSTPETSVKCKSNPEGMLLHYPPRWLKYKIENKMSEKKSEDLIHCTSTQKQYVSIHSNIVIVKR